jgi:maltose alpha-D-glucosyltransferase/alpha-amylase
MQELIGRNFYERIVRLGERTAEMHIALASDTTNPAFAPEPLTREDLESLHTSLRKSLKDSFALLEDAIPALLPDARQLALEALGAADEITALVEPVDKGRAGGMKTRIHGDYHLGQVLFTGKDFLIIDFEGEPGLSFTERRLKKSPLKDVAGMMRSFHYAAYGRILLNENYRRQDLKSLDQAAEQWQHYVSRFYLGAYIQRLGSGAGLSREDESLIRMFLLEKAIYELGYELNARPDWVKIPLKGIYYLVNRYKKA